MCGTGVAEPLKYFSLTGEPLLEVNSLERVGEGQALIEAKITTWNFG